jgi:hypothetical protein
LTKRPPRANGDGDLLAAANGTEKQPIMVLTPTICCGILTSVYNGTWFFLMNCPYCQFVDSKVVDSRDVSDGVRRRRECLACGSRFTTYERVQAAGLFVIKKDLRREEFNKDKLLTGIRKAC